MSLGQQVDLTPTLLSSAMAEHIVCLKQYNYSVVQNDTLIIDIQKNNFIENNLSSHLGTRLKLNFFNGKEILKKAKKGSFFLTVINRPQIYSGFIRFDIIMYNMIYKNHILNYIKIASTVVTFKFDCISEQYMLDKVEHY